MGRLLRADEISVAVDALAAGRLVAFPTETVYGLGADASRPEAVAAIFATKGRPTGHPLIVHLADADDLDRMAANVSPGVKALAAAFWPGPLTIVVERTDQVAPETVGGMKTVGLRVPDHPIALELLARFGAPVAAPSANRFGSVSPTTAQHVIDDLGAAVDHVIDGGPCAVGVESTIIDMVGEQPTLLRPGGISTLEIEAVLGVPVIDGRAGPVRASGMLSSHYAPRANVVLVDGPDDGAEAEDVDEVVARLSGRSRVGLMAPFASAHEPSWLMPSEAGDYAARLYATMRDADRHGLDHLVVVPPRSGPLLQAVLDRLQKAAAPRR